MNDDLEQFVGRGLAAQRAVDAIFDKPKPRRGNSITLKLPPEFLQLCKGDNVEPEAVLRGFIADLAEIHNYCSAPRADGYGSNGSDERRMAMEYYERVGWPWINKPS